MELHDYKITSQEPGNPTMVMVSAELIADDAAIAARFPDADVGTILHTAGYGVMKQKGLDGSWAEI